jgi:hypothetical protein
VRARAGGLAAAALLIGACGATGPTPLPSATFSTASVPSASSGITGPTATAGASPSPAASPALSPSDSSIAVRDDSLLSILPPDVESAPVTVEEASFDDAVTDAAFAEHVARAAFAIVTTPTDLASGVVAQLRPGLLDDTFLADWRETYNEGACAQAGGVATNAETELDGRTVYIATCGGGLTVYHAAIPERDVIVSLFSIGEDRFGEQLMRDLRP